MVMRKRLLALCAALAALLAVGPACGSEPAAPVPTTAAGTPVAATAAMPAPTPTPIPAATPESRAVGGMSAAVIAPPPSPGGAADTETPASDAMTRADFPTPPDRDLLLLARQLRWDGVEPDHGPDRFAGRELEIGETAEFWILDYPRREMVRKEFRLAAVSQRAYWWVEQGLEVDDADLRRTVEDVETLVYPRVAAVFGEVPPSARGGPRGHIINGRIPGVGGYVSGADPYPATVQQFSNEAAAIYINAELVRFGSDDYLSVLAHELQHGIHWYADASEDTWLNEGLSELAVTEAGFSPGSVYHYLRRPGASLVNWPDSLEGNVGLNYGAAALFAHYLRERYAPEGGLRDLLAGQRNGIAAVDAFLDGRGAVTATGEPADFHTVFADWIVANRLDSDDGRYGYANLGVGARTTRTVRLGGQGAEVSLAQYGIDYVEVKDIAGSVTISFEGDGLTALLPADVPAGGCWWTNRGDDISSTLTRNLAIPDEEAPTLTFHRWYDIEEDWDYLYLEASMDGGATWDVLPADGTTDANPLGNSYGHGFTGADDWDQVTVSLADYAGQEALVRFHYVTDDAIHGPGACIRDLSVSWDDAGAGDWRPNGFVLVNNRVRQDWIVWVIGDGPQPSAARLPLRWDAGQQRYTGSMPAPAPGDGGSVVVAVSPVAPATMQPGRYRVWATAAN